MNSLLVYVLLVSTYFLTSVEFDIGEATISLAQLPIVMMIPALIKRGRILSSSLWILTVSAFGGFLAILEFGDAFNLPRFPQQLLGLFLAINVAWIIARTVRDRLHVYLKAYFVVGAFMSFIGIIEEVSFLTGLYVPFSSIVPHWQEGGISGAFIRVSSIQGEPTHFAVILIPLAIVSLYALYVRRPTIVSNKLTERVLSVCILVAFVLTFSTTAYLALFLTGFVYWLFSLDLRRIGTRFIVALLLIASFAGAFLYIPTFRERVQLPQSKEELLYQSPTQLAVMSNMWLAKEVLFRHPLFGVGIGNNAVAFSRYILPLHPETVSFYNQASGASLLLRYFNEGGVVLVVLILWLIFRGRLTLILRFGRLMQYSTPQQKTILVFQYGTLAGVFAYFIRRGLYIDLNFWILVFLGKYYPEA